MPEAPRKKILVVDDESEVLQYIDSILRRSGYEVMTTTSGREAVDLAKQHQPDLLILDVLIPDMMGGEVQNMLLQDSSTAHIPIIFITGLNTKEEERIISEGTGTCRVLAKPVSAEKLLGAVSHVFSEETTSSF